MFPRRDKAKLCLRPSLILWPHKYQITNSWRNEVLTYKSDCDIILGHHVITICPHRATKCDALVVMHLWWSSVCLYRAIVNLHLERYWSSVSPQSYCHNLNLEWCWSSVCLHRAIVNLNLEWRLSSVCSHRAIVNLNLEWCWPSMCPHRAIVNLQYT